MTPNTQQVWRLDDASGRSAATGLCWEEDLQWAARLDVGWDLGLARRLAAKLVNNYSNPGLLKVGVRGGGG